MKDEQQKLTRALDRELKGLPDLEAPGVLTERVMARVREMDSVAWWRRSWFEWPVGVRVATALVMLVWLAGAGAVEWASPVDFVGAVVKLVGMAFAFVTEMIAGVPFVVWLLLGAVAAISWFTLLGASVVCWQLVKLRR